MPTAIELRDVHKSFRLPHEVHTTLTERILSGFRGMTYEHFEALRGVDLSIERGAFVGIIGGNGSGKSTLLKIVSGLLPPDRGEVHVDGSMSALLELGLGFSAELTVRENVELYAAVLGYPRREVTRRVDEAIAFAGLERFRDAKLKNLSTGMRARLGFATALQADSDILLLDEILAVGDADFQLKCLDVFERFKQERRTIVLVTHDLTQVQRFCDECVLLQRGVIVERGDPDAVIPHYLRSVGRLAGAHIDLEAPGHHRAGDGRVRAAEGWLEDEAGERIGRVRCGERVVVVVVYDVVEDTHDPVFGVSLVGEDGTVMYSTNTHWDGTATERLRAGLRVEVRVPLTVALRNGRYSVQAGVGMSDLSGMHDLVDGIATLVVTGSRVRHGITDLLGRVSYRILDQEGEAAAVALRAERKRGAQ